MISGARVASLIGHIYDAAVAPSGWPAFLTEFADAVHGTATQFLHHDLTGRAGKVDVGVRLDPEARAQYAAHYGRLDPWLQSGLRGGVLRCGQVFVGESLVPHDEMVKTAYYNEFARPFHVTRVLAAIIRMDRASVATFSTVRFDDKPEFEAWTKKLLQLLFPHLTRAIEIHRRLEGIDLKTSCAVDALDALAAGVIAVSADRSILFSNRSGASLLITEDGLRSRSGRLDAEFAEDARELESAIGRAAAGPTASGCRAPHGVRIRRRAHDRPLELLIIPVSRDAFPRQDRRSLAALVFAIRPEGIGASPDTLLRELYGLTRTEAKIAQAFASGLDLAAVADQLGISRNTVRWHFKHVLAKTDARTQADLARLLTSSATLAIR